VCRHHFYFQLSNIVVGKEFQEGRSSAFNEWIKIKNEQKKQEEKLARERERDMMEGEDDKNKQDSEKSAFKK